MKNGDKSDRIHLDTMDYMYGHIISSLTVGYQNDGLMNFLVTVDI